MVHADQAHADATPGLSFLPDTVKPTAAVLLRAEVQRAEESQRVLDLLGRALVTMTPDRAADVAEAVMERACIQAEPAADAEPSGLVSVPTTHTRKSGSVARDASLALQGSLDATTLDPRKARVARLRRAVGFSARAIGAALDRPGIPPHYVAMLTLTYRSGDDWRAEHVTSLVNHLRNHMSRSGLKFRYVWVAELQKRGALHYHIALWLPCGVKLPMADQRGWWPHGWTNICEARRAVPYLLKYMSKGLDFAGFPKGARIYGAGGLEPQLRRAKRWLGLPSFVKSRADIHDDWRRVRGGGWASPEGQIMPSEFERAWVGDGWCCRQVVDYGRPFKADGPFSWLHRQPAPVSGAA